MNKGLRWLAMAAAMMIAGQAYAGEVDLLVEKLVAKDILTPSEAQILLDETKTQLGKDMAAGRVDSLPSWIQTMQFKGDFRARYQNEETDTTSGSSKSTAKRERGRIRFRLGADAMANNEWKVGFGLATGVDDRRSTNATLDNVFSPKTITLDYAYAKYSPLSNLFVTMGKPTQKDMFWAVSDLLWDTDINPEGIGIHGDLFNVVSGLDLFLNFNYLLLDELSGGAEPTMVMLQPGFSYDVTEMINLKSSINYYLTNSVQGQPYNTLHSPKHGGGTNTLRGSDFRYDYDCLGFSAELGVNLQKDAEKRELVNYVSLVADYIQNPDPDDQNTGFLYGVKFGDKRISDPGTWQVYALYRELEKDAWLDFLPDSDVISGITDVKGYEVIFQYGLAKNVSLGFDYYRSETIKASTKKEQSLYQVDCVVKF
ncbi:MAG: putative porin [Candidatus Omnitrophica bacterium]|nr:putative porin [Candidatus Omnitrophota bacterium]